MDATTISLSTLEREGEVLACPCGRKYAIVDGVPIVGLEVGAEPDLDVTEAAGPDDSPQARQLEHLSTYLDAHWGDAYDRGLRPFVERLAQLPRVARAVELGCSAGRALTALAADHVTGIEMNFAMLRRARALLDGKTVRYARRVVGRHYDPAEVRGIATACELVCADALDPPLVPGAFDRVVALNMLDSVREPDQLLAVVDGLCAPGGEIILSSPYAWQTGVVAEGRRLGGADPAGYLTARLSAGTDLRAPYTIAEEAEVTWTLRRDARSEVSYRVHYLRARKGT
jgi:SAM-dependent methyltransferase